MINRKTLTSENLNRKTCRLHKQLLSLVIGCFAIAPLAACQSLGSTPPVTPDDPLVEEPEGLKVGAILPYTGELASVGQPMIETLPLLIDQVNACGGVNDHSVSLVVEDDQSRSEVAASAMTKLISVEKVNVVAIGFVDSDARQALDIAVQNKIPIVSPATTSPVFSERAANGEFEGYWARTVPSDMYQARALAKLAIKRRYRRVSIVVANTDDGISFEQAFIEAFEALGGTVLNKDYPTRYPPEASSLTFEAFEAFSPYAGEPDAVVAALDDQGGALLLTAAYEAGLSQGTPVLIAGNIQPQSLLEEINKFYDGKEVLKGAFGAVPRASGPALDNFIELWKERLGETPGAYVAHTWDAVALLMLAAQAASSNDGALIKEQLAMVANPPGVEVTNICTGLKLLKSGQDIDYQGAGSNLNLDEHGDVVGNYDVWTVNDEGEIKVLEQITLD
ncbi:ABC transporter substrate-binding protein [Thermocoleostomius sinensis]|uniref:ABC transporter substrate-binding protein n=1 Tax=Thermocoleostomius sinensis A174 TaxID=2016057 RepID=A0A9E8ZJ36_9CYAN|nr:ABC transporter substrate-binding protein [Thermocoleostomius sinensis]WAL62682.1 ABC transporter substrate-binding protein [Thermocoleostomius sinensis A174]